MPLFFARLYVLFIGGDSDGKPSQLVGSPTSSTAQATSACGDVSQLAEGGTDVVGSAEPTHRRQTQYQAHVSSDVDGPSVDTDRVVPTAIPTGGCGAYRLLQRTAGNISYCPQTMLYGFFK